VDRKYLSNKNKRKLKINYKKIFYLNKKNYICKKLNYGKERKGLPKRLNRI